MDLLSVSTASTAKVVTASDTEDLPEDVCRGLYVGTGGDVKVRTRGGDEVTWKNVQDGSIMNCAVSRVFSTGTTASDILALY